MTDIILSALTSLLTPIHFLYLLMGTMLGLVVGILPGLGGIAGLSLLLPFVYGGDPSLVLPMMVGLLAVTNTSDTFPAVLMGIPGTSSSQATIVDGFPLAKKGEAARALGAAFSASMIGGLFGAFILTLAVLFARPLILAVGFSEQLMLVILALTMVGMLTGTSVVKGLAACGFGLLIGSIGAVPATGEYRFEFGTNYLSDGIPLVIVGLAMFAVPELVEIMRQRARISSVPELGSGTMRGFWETMEHKWLVLRCSTIGTIIGALPGLGGSIATWMSYGHVVQSSKDRTGFGEGDIRGVIAPESTNNADRGGELIPTLMFGIPGSGSMAVFLGALILIGVEPGIGMLERHLDLTFLMIWTLALANVIGTVTCLVLAKPIARFTLLPFMQIAPFMVAIIYFAAYQATVSWYDLIALFGLGVLGMYFKRFGWSRPALLIGFVLSKRLDAAVYQTIQVYGWSLFERTGVQVMLVLIVVSILVAVRMKPHRQPLTAEGPHACSKTAPQMMFLAAITACVGYAIYEASHLTFLGKVFPLSVALVTLALLIAAFVPAWRNRPSYLLYDRERELAADQPLPHSELYFQAWMLGLLATSALLGFVLGMFAYVALFLRLKADLAWHKAALGAFCAVIVLSLLSYFLVVDYPGGLLQSLFELPWPFN